jgi:imidazolonepropionase-like amidohydrolase
MRFLERPETRYIPDSATPDWRPSNNPYLKRWTLADIPKMRAQYSLMQRLVRGLRDARVPLLAGTDDMVPCQLPGFSMKDELEQLVEAGLTPFEALQAATSNAARFLGTTADTGTVAPGKVADLVLLDANPLDDVDNVFRQDGVMLRAAAGFPRPNYKQNFQEWLRPIPWAKRDHWPYSATR